MKYLFSFFLLLSVSFVHAQKQFVIDANAEPREIQGSFSSIRVSSSVNLFLSKSDEEAIAISASEEKYKEGIKTEISNGVLHIYYSGEKLHYGNNMKLNVYVAYENLSELNVSGASDVLIAGVMELPSLSIQLTGASDLKGEIKVGDLNIKLSGASDVKLTGTAKNVNIESSGASDVKAFGLIAENCNAKVSGASDVNITVNKEISANASGASDVHFKGPAEIKMKQATGASNVARVD